MAQTQVRVSTRHFNLCSFYLKLFILGPIHLDVAAVHLQPVPAEAGALEARHHAGHGDLPQGDGRHQEDEED